MLDFLGIGAQKSGTTWLYEQLRRHPQVARALCVIADSRRVARVVISVAHH